MAFLTLKLDLKIKVCTEYQQRSIIQTAVKYSPSFFCLFSVPSLPSTHTISYAEIINSLDAVYVFRKYINIDASYFSVHTQKIINLMWQEDSVRLISERPVSFFNYFVKLLNHKF